MATKICVRAISHSKSRFMAYMTGKLLAAERAIPDAVR